MFVWATACTDVLVFMLPAHLVFAKTGDVRCACQW
jgi:hypothetical protein